MNVWPRDGIRLQIGIQHHLCRPLLLTRLQAQLRAELGAYDQAADGYGTWRVDGGLVRVDVAYDNGDDANPWRGAQLAWSQTMAVWPTHRLVLQDDSMLCEDFVWGAIEAIRHRPEALVVLFVGPAPAAEAQALRDASWRSSWHLYGYRTYIPCIALAMPAHLARELAGVTPVDPWRPSIADDEVVARWLVERQARGAGVDVWATAPSLVQHDDDAPSTIIAHRSAPRVAACFLADYSAKVIDFSR